MTRKQARRAQAGAILDVIGRMGGRAMPTSTRGVGRRKWVRGIVYDFSQGHEPSAELYLSMALFQRELTDITWEAAGYVREDQT